MDLANLTLTRREKQMLVELSQAARYPIVRFELHSSEEEELLSVALDAVRITETDDSMELVKERGAALRRLADLGLVVLDYDVSVWGQGDYDVYYRSNLYKLFCHTAMEAAQKPGFLFNLAVLRKGRARLTRTGVDALHLC